jgi:hypothetical protein
MGNNSKLVSRSIRSETITPKPITRYFDGGLCLGNNLAKAAIHNYGYTISMLAKACRTHPSTVRSWYSGSIPPQKQSVIKLLHAIEAIKDFRRSLDKRPKSLYAVNKSEQVVPEGRLSALPDGAAINP